MNDEQFSVELVCLFCREILTADENIEFESGDLIKCSSCGEQNDYDSVVEVAIEKGTDKVAKDFEKEISKTLKKIFK